MEKILCPVDFTLSSETAAHWAAKIAAEKNWELILFHKYLISDFKNEIHNYNQDVIENASSIATRKLTALKESLCKFVGDKTIECNIKLEYGIDLEEMIINAAKASKVSLIVMGTEGAESFSDIIFGSHTSNIINKSQIPVLVVPTSANRALPDTIIYASDLKFEDQKSINELLNFSRDLFKKIIILHSKEIGKEKASESLLDKFKPLIPIDHHFEIEYTQIFSNNLYQGIQEFASSQENSVIALGRHPKSFLDFLSTGSFTRLMTLYSFIPTLIFHKHK